MSAQVLAEFASEEAFSRAYEEAPRRGFNVVGGYAPFPPEVSAHDPRDKGPAIVTAALALGGFGAAAAFYLTELWTATIAYPINSGGRPLDSWPAFIMGPFEFGVFCAGLSGFLALLWVCGLPKPHDPIFEVQGIERVSEDRFLLALAQADGVEDFAFEMGALSAREAEL